MIRIFTYSIYPYPCLSWVFGTRLWTSYHGVLPRRRSWRGGSASCNSCHSNCNSWRQRDRMDRWEIGRDRSPDVETGSWGEMIPGNPVFLFFGRAPALARVGGSELSDITTALWALCSLGKSELVGLNRIPSTGLGNLSNELARQHLWVSPCRASSKEWAQDCSSHDRKEGEVGTGRQEVARVCLSYATTV